MSDLQDLTNELMQDDEFRREYEALRSERGITLVLVQMRKESGLVPTESIIPET